MKRLPGIVRRLKSRGIVIGILSVFAYLALEWVSEVHEHKGLPVTAWNPGLGLVFATMMRRPPMGAAILFLGMVLAEIAVVHSIMDIGMIAVLSATSATIYALSASIARKCFHLDLAVERLNDIAGLLIVGCLGAATNAILLTLLLIFAGFMTWSDIGDASLPLFVGDLIGIAVVTPLTLRLVVGGLGRHGSWRAPQVAIGFAVVTLPIAVSLWLILRSGDPGAVGHLYVLFLPIVGAALWLGLDGACVGLAIGQLVLVLLMRLYGYDANAFTAFQTVMTVLGATGLLCGAVVSERNAATRAARATGARLAEREAEAVRADRFSLATGMTSALSHEIFQPITAARALARAAQLRVEGDGAPDMARLRENLLGVLSQIDLAAEILHRMRALVGRGEPERHLADIPTIVEDAMVLMRPRASRHQVVVEVDYPSALPGVKCDRIQIQQVLMNLIGNAIDAIDAIDGGRKPGGGGHVAVRVALAQTPGQIVFSVRDNGPGIPPELSRRVFEPLITAKTEGLGLGLSICSLIVEAHGGRIWLESPGPDGTEFRFWLPSIATDKKNGR